MPRQGTQPPAVVMQESESALTNQTHKPDESLRLRDKILGVTIRKARMAAGRSILDCASHLEIVPDAVDGWEFGEGRPSLRQMEMLASYLKVSVSEFWGGHHSATAAQSVTDQDEFIALRRRLVGGLLRAAREEKGLSIEQLSIMVDVDVNLLCAYELGERVISTDQLSIFASAVDRDLEYFQETKLEPTSMSPFLAEWPLDLDLPEELLQLAADHKTQGLFKLAAAFGQLPGDELKRIADALMAISAAKSRQNGA